MVNPTTWCSNVRMHLAGSRSTAAAKALEREFASIVDQDAVQPKG
jgi:hypothetical protein